MPNMHKYRNRAKHAPPISVTRPKPESSIQPSNTLLFCPVEILDQIINHLVPSDETFRIGSDRIPSIDESSRSLSNLLPPHPSTQHAWFVHPGTTTSHRLLPASFLPFTAEWPVRSLLLTCRTLYDPTVRRLYSTNTFSFPDPDSAILFSRQLTARTRELVRFVHVDACGGVVVRERLARSQLQSRSTTTTSNQQISVRRYTFDHGVDARIVDVPPYFPCLWELRVGGVGPGVVKKDVYAGVLDTREDRREWYPSAVAVLARIVGLEVSSSALTTIPSSIAGVKHTLRNGRVFLCRSPSNYDEDDEDEMWSSTSKDIETNEDEHSKSFGALQVHGTRIISSFLAAQQHIIEDLVGKDWQTLEINVQDLLDRVEVGGPETIEERQKNEEWQEKREEILRRVAERKKRMGGEGKEKDSGTWGLGTGIGNVVGTLKKGWGLFG